MKKKGFYFDKEAADRAVSFFIKCIVHVKGEWAGRPLILEPWQEKIVRDVFGWKRPDGTRKYKTVYIEVPRKNGKSTLGAGLANYLLFADREPNSKRLEPGAEVYSAAGDRFQAGIIFNMAKQMSQLSSELRSRSQAYKHSIYVPESMSCYQVLSSDVKTKHGVNAHGVIFDELHTQPTRDLWDVLDSSTGSRRQALVVAITTAGYDKQSICFEQHEYARKVIDGIIEDDSFYAVIYAAADDDDDWADPAVWAKANPNLGVSLKMEYLENKFKKALESPAYQNTFRRLHLNQWTSQETRWLDLKKWDACIGELPALEGRPCYAGLDLASSVDIAAFVLVFPMDDGRVVVLPMFWIPGDNLLGRCRKDRVPYDAWVREGLMQTTEGNVIDYAAILNAIVAASKKYNIEQIAFDRWGAVQITQQLAARGLTVVEFGQGYKSMSPPTKELLRLVVDKKLMHDGNKVLRWMADNMVVVTDPSENVKPDKSRSREKIDGMVALIMAIDVAGRHQKSIYDKRGMTVF